MAALSIKVIGDTIFYDNIAIADMRDDVLATHRDDFIRHIELSKHRYSTDSDLDLFNEGRKEGHEEGYAEGLADAAK